MALLEEKIAEIKDPELRRIIDEEVKALKKEKSFGLVFERHQPEVAPLYQARITLRETVAKRTGNLAETYRVESIHAEQANLIKDSDDSRETVPLTELVVVRRMGEPIYPALISQDRISTTSQKVPHHILIEADNYHALQLLGYVYAGQVDCIYIDPPYNKGAKDWKYNNNYVDKADQYRHSKWLAFMKKRLRISKQLLKPESGVLIITIDEGEIYHLGCLLEQEFPTHYRQLVTIVINPKGVTQGRFSRVEEYALFAFGNKAYVKSIGDDLLSPKKDGSQSHTKTPRWKGLLRSGTNARRQDREKMFYPVLIDLERSAVIGAGEYLPLGKEPDIHATVDGYVAAWPIRTDGTYGNWGVGLDTIRSLINKGYVAMGRYDQARHTWGFTYLSQKYQKQIEQGILLVTEYDQLRNLVTVEYEGEAERQIKTVWNRSLHDAGAYGADLLKAILGEGRKFSFPKSVYAVRDTLLSVMRDKPDAITLDFFAGSGTTLNAINLLNATDGGQRQCIMVTNNEVSEEEAHTLTEQGFQPGQTEWDRHGICQSVTWPRSKFTIQGMRDDGTPLPGDYLTGQQVAREKPRTIRQLGFAEGRHLTLSQRKQVAALLPTVPQNKMDDGPWFMDDDIAVSILWEAQQAEAWLEALAETDHITELHVVTQESRLFNILKKQIAETLGPLTVMEDDKRPLAAGFPANLDYFKLDFLQPAEVAMGQQFAAILPILWMKAGAVGPCPEPPAPQAHWLIPVDCPFVVLMRESRFREFLAKVGGREDLTHVYLVTNSDSAFHDMLAEFPDHLEIIQLYKSYLDNFRINTATPNRSVP